ncbi:hypothetical protein JOC34_000487 [Virgibacillus halotolerans]|uniref:hypothetical protein n=1 Tax=Virgibacillus halotolerans TaxID=1071053 RepID=UPI00195F6061|nr:hypothetical protein [Virgibacillus halotolerans]MBM7598130.1 hypothetical protein [Virgibacillus halotolerans]
MEYNRQSTIDWLENNQINGAFEGFPENNLNFNELSNEVLEFYFYESVLPERLEQEEQEG